MVLLAVLGRCWLENVVRDDRDTNNPRSRDQNDARASRIQAAAIDTKPALQLPSTMAESSASICILLDVLRRALFILSQSAQDKPDHLTTIPGTLVKGSHGV